MFLSDAIFYSRRLLLPRFSAASKGTLSCVLAILQLPAPHTLGEVLQGTAYVLASLHPTAQPRFHTLESLPSELVAVPLELAEKGQEELL